MPIPTASERIGSVLDGRYALRAILARGGMGVVYDAVDRETGREVVVKLPLPSDSDDRDARARFMREAELAQQLSHPNVVAVLDARATGDAPYFVMERLHGQPLSELLAVRGRLTAEEALSWLLPIMDAVARAHDAQVIHRDLKPSNIFMHEAASGEVVPKLLDFGIAKALEGTTITHTGRTVGTPEFMSPEQASGAPLDARTDVWSMAVILYRCLSGVAPFEGPVYEAGRAPASLSQRAPELPSRLAAAIDRGLAFEPADRYAGMRDFALAIMLTATSGGLRLPEAVLPISHRSLGATSTAQRVEAGLQRHVPRRRAAAIAVGCAFAVVIGLALASRDEPPAVPAARAAPGVERAVPPAEPSIEAPTPAPPAPAPIPPAAASTAPRAIAKPPAKKPRSARAQHAAPVEPAAPAPAQGGLPAVETQW